MPRSVSQYQQVKAAFQQKNQSSYEAFREALRILIPYEWRRRVVHFVRSRFGAGALLGRARAGFSNGRAPAPNKVFRRGDFYESVTLLPHIPDAEVEAILNNPICVSNTARPDIICFSIIDWSFRFQRPQQLMAQFAAHGHRVFYLNVSQFLDPSAQPKFAVKELRENLFEVQIAAASTPQIFVSTVEGRNLNLALESLDELRRAFNINEAISYVMIPSWGKAALSTRQRWTWRVIYDCMDEWENFPGVSSQSLETERDLAKNCDLLVVTAQRLYDKWLASQSNIILARNAADYQFFAANCQPNDLLEGVKHPIIGYYGAIADWFDVDLMIEAAERRPDYSFVFLGGVFNVDVSGLRALPNVRLLGQQAYKTMPQYLYHFDVCVIPFKINSITEATDPVKLYEYLSGGKPVVSVNLPELRPYLDQIYIANDAADFTEKIDLALKETSTQLIESRKSVARRHTWLDRYNSITSRFKETTPPASIIIVAYNNLALTKLCLESVFRNTDYPSFEVIVVDNKSADGTQKYLQSLAEKRDNLTVILNDTNNGFAKANNQGIEASKGDYLVLLNNDAIVPQGWLSRLLLHLHDPQVGLVGPVTNFVGNEAKIDVSYRTWAEMEVFAREYIWDHDRQVADIYMLAMFCVAMRREVFEKVGPLDEQFGIGMFEDDDYSMRVKQCGYRTICAADGFVHHFGQAAFGKLIRSGDYDRLFNENRGKYERKWGVDWTPHQNDRLNFETHLLADNRDFDDA